MDNSQHVHKLDAMEDAPVAPPAVVPPSPITVEEEDGLSQWPMRAAILSAAGGGAAASAAAKAFLSAAVGVAGFGPTGVIANSFAASVQGAAVASNSLFAACQSIGATSSLAYLGGAGLLVVGGAAAIGATVVGAGVYVGLKKLSKRNAGQSFSHTTHVGTLEDEAAWAQILKTVNTAKILCGDVTQGIATRALRRSTRGSLFNMQSNGIAGKALWKNVPVTGLFGSELYPRSEQTLNKQKLHRKKLSEQGAAIAEVHHSGHNRLRHHPHHFSTYFK
ncbi:hypothetical protein QOT17_017350 [Balamuthia mandrillaris]